MHERRNSHETAAGRAHASGGTPGGGTVALRVVAALGIVYALYWMQDILVSIVLGVLLAYALYPLVLALTRKGVPRWLAGGVALVVLFMAVAGTTYAISSEAATFLERLPSAIDRANWSIRELRINGSGAIGDVAEAAQKLEEATVNTETKPGVTPVEVVRDRVDFRDYVWWGSLGAFAAVAQLFGVLLLVFVFLVSAEDYKRRIVALAGPRFMRRRRAVRILRGVSCGMRQYLMMMMVSGLFVGVLTWLAFLAIGFEQAAFWGVVAGVLSSVPYVGPFIVFVATGVMAFAQFNSLWMALVVAGTSLIITSIQGFGLLPWLVGRASQVNVPTLIVGIFFWAWLWGPWGVLFSAPITIICKVICDHVDYLRPIGTLLGTRESLDAERGDASSRRNRLLARGVAAAR